jgi:hypothetical protein
MLLLLLKGYWWAAWWPYSTWFLAVDKALCRMNQGCEPPQYQTNDEGQVSIRESAMANDVFVKPEIPESMRDLMKMSIEQQSGPSILSPRPAKRPGNRSRPARNRRASASPR